MKREFTFNIRMSERERAQLGGIAQHYGLNACGTIRMLIKREADRLRTERARQTPKQTSDPPTTTP